MDADFPAAQSMDSCWFGVDRDGRVGFFDTGEAGAQPTRGLVAQGAVWARRRLGQVLPAGESVVDLRGRRLPYLKGGGMVHLFGGGDFPTLMFLDSLDPVRDALADGRAVEVPARDGAAVLWHTLSDIEYNRLHRGRPAVCRGCFWRFEALDEPAEEGEEPRVNLARRGVYVFKALGGNATANPYGVQEIPLQPVHVDQLPPDIRARVKEVTFAAVSFADTPVFQPAEHVPCTGYEGTYTDLSGRIHPLPDAGAMTEYERLVRLDEEYERLVRLDEMMGPEGENEDPPF
jgi:hypothetical protein